MMSKPDFELPLTAPVAGGQNGRVSFLMAPSAGRLGPPANAGFSFPQGGDDLAKVDLMRGNWEENPVSDTFFSVSNINRVQSAIKSEVYKRSGEKRWNIDEQDVDELKIIMRSMYYQYGKNLPTNVQGQVQDLNQIVIDWAVPRIMSEVQHYLYYLNDIDKLPVPMERPVLMTRTGTKSKPYGPLM